MHDPQNRNDRPVNPRRRKRTKMQIFKEAYLPLIVAAVALLLILIFIIGSITRAVQWNQLAKKESIAASVAAEQQQEAWEKEAANLLSQAKRLAAGCNYDAAVQLLDSFSGQADAFPELETMRQSIQSAADALVLWEDPGKVLNLSFQPLIADPVRAFQDAKYGSSYKKNFITTSEFTKILQQLYENDYILVDMDDLVKDGQVCQLYLPEGKKPIMLTQTQVNYYRYMTDSDGDGLPDAGGAGFASRLVLDDSGNLTCEMVTASGISTGAYDLVPILEAFIATHPDFSYKGARAILAVTGYDGIFGYRTCPTTEIFTQDFVDQETENAKKVVQALRNAGYEIACYTYDNVAYGNYTAAQIQSDVDRWTTEVSPILGVVRTLVYARSSDIAGRNTAYSGEKFDILQRAGFTHFLGFCSGSKPWLYVQDTYVRQGRLLVGGSKLTDTALFSGIFDPSAIIDPARS